MQTACNMRVTDEVVEAFATTGTSTVVMIKANSYGRGRGGYTNMSGQGSYHSGGCSSMNAGRNYNDGRGGNGGQGNDRRGSSGYNRSSYRCSDGDHKPGQLS